MTNQPKFLDRKGFANIVGTHFLSKWSKPLPVQFQDAAFGSEPFFFEIAHHLLTAMSGCPSRDMNLREREWFLSGFLTAVKGMQEGNFVFVPEDTMAVAKEFFKFMPTAEDYLPDEEVAPLEAHEKIILDDDIAGRMKSDILAKRAGET